MKILARLMVLILAFTYANAFVNFDQFHDHIQRVRRQTAEDGSLCLLTCIETMEAQLGAVKSSRTQNTRVQPSSTCQRYEPDQLDALCLSHKDAKRCLDGCPEGEMRNVGINALNPLNFMCMDRLNDFKQHLPCLDSICDSIEASCQPVCHQYKVSVDKLTGIQRDQSVRQTYDTSAILKIITDACGYIDCFNDCSRPQILGKCGAGAADLQRDTVRKAFSSITNLLANTGDSEEFPNACLSILSEETNTTIFPTSTSATTTSWTTGQATKPTKGQGRGSAVNYPTVTGETEADQDQIKLLLEEARLLSSGEAIRLSVHLMMGFALVALWRLL